MHTTREAPTQSNRLTPASVLPRHAFCRRDADASDRLHYEACARGRAERGVDAVQRRERSCPHRVVFYTVIATWTALGAVLCFSRYIRSK